MIGSMAAPAAEPETMRAVLLREFGGPEVLRRRAGAGAAADPDRGPGAGRGRRRQPGRLQDADGPRDGAGAGRAADLPRLGRRRRRHRDRAGGDPLRGRRRGLRDAVVPAPGRRLRRVRDRALAPLRAEAARALDRGGRGAAAGGADRLAGRRRHGPRAGGRRRPRPRRRRRRRPPGGADRAGARGAGVRDRAPRAGRVAGRARGRAGDRLPRGRLRRAARRTRRGDRLPRLARRAPRSACCGRAGSSSRCRAASAATWSSRPSARGLRATGFLVEPDPVGLAGITALVEAGELQVQVDRVFALERAADAHRLAESSHGGGKIALRV